MPIRKIWIKNLKGKWIPIEYIADPNKDFTENSLNELEPMQGTNAVANDKVLHEGNIAITALKQPNGDEMSGGKRKTLLRRKRKSRKSKRKSRKSKIKGGHNHGMHIGGGRFLLGGGI